MTVDEIIKLIQAVSENDLSSFTYENDGQKLTMNKNKVVYDYGPTLFPAQPQPGNFVKTESAENTGVGNVDIGSDKVVTSPLVGTFYCASSPEADPFVQVGDTVKKGQVLGIIEAMKLMNEIESEYDGVVEAVLVKNEEVVEFGQPLFRIR